MFVINTVTEIGTGVELDRGQERTPCAYLALCGAMIDPAPLVAPPRGRCIECLQRADLATRVHSSRWWTRLLGRRPAHQGPDHDIELRRAGP